MQVITITLSSANMGTSTTEADYDAWANYVTREIEEALDLGDDVCIEVDQAPYGAGGEDIVRGAGDRREAILSWLAVDGWEAFCADSSLWPADLCPIAMSA